MDYKELREEFSARRRKIYIERTQDHARVADLAKKYSVTTARIYKILWDEEENANKTRQGQGE